MTTKINDFNVIVKNTKKHLDPKKTFIVNLGDAAYDTRDTKLIDDIRAIENYGDDLTKVVTLLVDIYSTAPKLFKKLPRELKKVQEESNRSLIRIVAYRRQKPLEVQMFFLKQAENWIKDETLRTLAINVLSKLLELRGSEATYKNEEDALNIQDFIIKLDQKIHDVRTQSLIQLFTAYRTTNKSTEKVRILLVIESGLRATIYPQHSRSNFDLAKQEMDSVVDFIEEELKNSLKADTLDNFEILSRVENLLGRLAEYSERGYKNIKLKLLQKEILARPGYKLFQVLIHPRFPIKEPRKDLSPSDAIKDIAKNFKIKDLSILEQIIEHASNSGGIYNSIKTFFRSLGEYQPTLQIKIVNKYLKDTDNTLWYYAGHGIGSLLLSSKYQKSAKELIEKINKSPSILQRKAIVDAFYELGLSKKSLAKDKEWASIQLLKLVKVVNQKNREDWHFKWSVADAVGELFTSKKTAKVCFQLLGECIRKVDGWKNNNQIIYDQVASAVFGLELHKKIKPYHADDLADLLKLFINAGKNSTDTDTFYQVVAIHNLPALFEFVEERLKPSKKNDSWIDVVPFNWDFVFEGLKPDNIPEKLKCKYLSQFADYALRVEFNEPAHLHIDRIWNSLTEKLGRKISYEILREKIKKTDTIEARIKATYLLRDFEEYDDENYWNFMEEQVIASKGDEYLLSEISASLGSGNISTEAFDSKKNHLEIWKSKENFLLKKFADSQISGLKGSLNFLYGKRQTIDQVLTDIHPKIRSHLIKLFEKDPNFWKELLKDVLLTCSDWMLSQRSEFQNLSEGQLRTILGFKLQSYFGKSITFETLRGDNGLMDINVSPLGAIQDTLFIECLIWYSNKQKATNKHSYHQKVIKCLGKYDQLEDECYLFTFLNENSGNKKLSEILEQSKLIVKDVDPNISIKELSIVNKKRLTIAFDSEHPNHDDKIIHHVFVDLRKK